MIARLEGCGAFAASEWNCSTRVAECPAEVAAATAGTLPQQCNAISRKIPPSRSRVLGAFDAWRSSAGPCIVWTRRGYCLGGGSWLYGLIRNEFSAFDMVDAVARRDCVHSQYARVSRPGMRILLVSLRFCSARRICRNDDRQADQWISRVGTEYCGPDGLPLPTSIGTIARLHPCIGSGPAMPLERGMIRLRRCSSCSNLHCLHLSWSSRRRRVSIAVSGRLACPR